MMKTQLINRNNKLTYIFIDISSSMCDDNKYLSTSKALLNHANKMKNSNRVNCFCFTDKILNDSGIINSDGLKQYIKKYIQVSPPPPGIKGISNCTDLPLAIKTAALMAKKNNNLSIVLTDGEIGSLKNPYIKEAILECKKLINNGGDIIITQMISKNNMINNNLDKILELPNENIHCFIDNGVGVYEGVNQILNASIESVLITKNISKNISDYVKQHSNPEYYLGNPSNIKKNDKSTNELIHIKQKNNICNCNIL